MSNTENNIKTSDTVIIQQIIGLVDGYCVCALHNYLCNIFITNRFMVDLISRQMITIINNASALSRSMFSNVNILNNNMYLGWVIGI